MSEKKIKLVWWSDQTGISTRGNLHILREAGHSVDPNAVDPEKSDFSDYDMIFTSIPDIEIDTDTPVVTQLCGYGPNFMYPNGKPTEAAYRTFDNSEEVITLDPKLYLDLRANAKEEYLEDIHNIKIIPNPTPPIRGGGTIYPGNSLNIVFLSHSKLKNPDKFLDIIDGVDKETVDGRKVKFWVPTGSKYSWDESLEWFKKDNVTCLPELRYSSMIALMRRADIGAVYSEAENQPLVIFEAWKTETPLITNNISMVQSVSKEYLEDMIPDFGSRAKGFHNEWRDKYMSGNKEHYIYTKNKKKYIEELNGLINNPERRNELAENGRSWIDKFWEPKDRGEAIGEVIS